MNSYRTVGNYFKFNNYDEGPSAVSDYEDIHTLKNDLNSVIEYDFKVNTALYGIEISGVDVETTALYADFKLLYSSVFTRKAIEMEDSEVMYLMHRSQGFIRRIDNAVESEIEMEFTSETENGLERLKRLLDTSAALYLLENDQPLSMIHAYLLTGLAKQQIRNAASQGEINLEKDAILYVTSDYYLSDGAFTVSDWIRSRKGFKHPPAAINTGSGDVVRVPFAADGTFFSPSCEAKRGGYQIGYRHGTGAMKQRYVDDYWDALEALKQMSTPRWRRPSATSGVPGTVTCRNWGQVDRKIIEDQLR